MLFALVLTLASVGALIGYIHHIPESINIMNLAAKIGNKLRDSVISMLEDEDRRDQADAAAVDVTAWRGTPGAEPTDLLILTDWPGYLQQIDLETLGDLARRHGLQIMINRSPGDFLAAQKLVMTVTSFVPLPFSYVVAMPLGTVKAGPVSLVRLPLLS